MISRVFVNRQWFLRGKLIAVAALVCTVALGQCLQVRHRRGDALEGKPWHASSEWAPCQPAQHSCGGGLTDVFFHTREEANPFIQYDLGSPTVVRELIVENRSDNGLQNRAVPLVAYFSDDGQTWREIARRDYWFQTWDERFAPTATRYLKLMVPKTTMLHLENVELRK